MDACSASSEYDSSYACDNTLDGEYDADGGWQANAMYNQWVAYDLKATHVVTGVCLVWDWYGGDMYGATSVRVDTSDDGSTWTEGATYDEIDGMMDGDGDPSSLPDVSDACFGISPVETQHVRLYLYQGTGDYLGVTEVRFLEMCPEPTTEPSPLPTACPSSAPTTSEPSVPPTARPSSTAPTMTLAPTASMAPSKKPTYTFAPTCVMELRPESGSCSTSSNRGDACAAYGCLASSCEDTLDDSTDAGEGWYSNAFSDEWIAYDLSAVHSVMGVCLVWEYNQYSNAMELWDAQKHVVEAVPTKTIDFDDCVLDFDKMTDGDGDAVMSVDTDAGCAAYTSVACDWTEPPHRDLDDGVTAVVLRDGVQINIHGPASRMPNISQEGGAIDIHLN